MRALSLMRAGFELAARILSHPQPVVIAAPGHTMAMGAFLALSGDYRIGTDGPYKVVTNEVAIGITMPRAGVELCRQRLAPAHFQRAALLSEVYTPADAVAAGFFDRVVASSELLESARAKAAELSKLNMKAHAETKLRLRKEVVATIRSGIMADQRDLLVSGLSQLVASKLRPARASRSA